MAESVNLLI